MINERGGSENRGGGRRRSQRRETCFRSPRPNRKPETCVANLLGHASKECFEIVKVQVGARELFLHELPDPLEESGEGDVGAIGPLVGPTGQEGDELAEGGDDERPRVTSLRKGAVVVLVGENGHLERLDVTGGEVFANVGHEAS